MDKIDPARLRQAIELHAQELLAQGLPPSVPGTIEAWIAASEEYLAEAEISARNAGEQEIPKEILDSRAFSATFRQQILALVESAMGCAALEAQIAEFKATLGDRPALQRLYAYLLAKYLEVIPQLTGNPREFNTWLMEFYIAESGVGHIAMALTWRKIKEFTRFPVTATEAQKTQGLWNWIDFILLQAYQLRNKVTLQGSTTTPEDVELLLKLKIVAREEAAYQFRNSQAEAGVRPLDRGRSA